MTGPQDRAHPRFDRDLALGLGVPRAATRHLPGTPDAAEIARDFAQATTGQWRTPVTTTALHEAVEALLHDPEPEGDWFSLLETPDALLLVLTASHAPPTEATARVLPAPPDSACSCPLARRWTRIPFPDSPRSHYAPPPIEPR
ncbi:hypothetical protein ACFRMQ_28115 [Kitasatospora sp. NPDC056783]|uniref:hypothetical protein n=1 Tax=Kitasatospora sp. NPDC056783 TaxID=3345943 RepID=UPI00369F2D8C